MRLLGDTHASVLMNQSLQFRAIFVCSDGLTQYVVDTQVMLDQKDLLDGLFDESGAVGAFAFLGDPPPETHVAMVIACVPICLSLAYMGSIHFYLSVRLL